jgi:hypothetical protein
MGWVEARRWEMGAFGEKRKFKSGNWKSGIVKVKVKRRRRQGNA